MSKGYQVIGEGDHFRIMKNKKSIISTSKIKTKHGFVVSIDPKHELNNITYDLMHQRLSHPGKDTTLKYEQILGEKYQQTYHRYSLVKNVPYTRVNSRT